jgi:hypothetical protein
MHTHKSLIVECPFWVEGGSGFVALSGYYGNIEASWEETIWQ